MARHEKKTQRRPILEIKVAHSGRRSDELWTLFRCRTDTGQFPTPWRCLARQRGGWLVGCGVGGCGHLPDNIDAKERGRDIAEAPTNESRRTCTTIEIPAGLSGGFDDDNYSPPERFGFTPRESGPRFEASPDGPPVQATVKWYNPEKGFGFVGLASGGDAFLHVSVVERSGNSTVPPGATLEVRIGSGQKGQQVTEILSVDASTAAQESARRPRPERPHTPPDQAAVEEFGTVKFYAA